MYFNDIPPGSQFTLVEDGLDIYTKLNGLHFRQEEKDGVVYNEKVNAVNRFGSTAYVYPESLIYCINDCVLDT